MRALTRLLRPWHLITSPVSYGLDNIPRRGPRPFAAVGAEEAWDIVGGGDQLVPAPLRSMLERFGLRMDALIPIVKGVGPTPLPRPERLYFWFGEPVDTRPYNGHYNHEGACWKVREQVKQSIQTGIKFLLKQRKADPGRDLLARLLGDGPARPARLRGGGRV